MPTEIIKLEDHYRGDDLEYDFTLEEGFLSSDISELWFTVRTQVPATSRVDDLDVVGGTVTEGVLAQVTLGGGGIVWLSATQGRVTIGRAIVTTWKPRNYPCDLQGLLTNGKQKTISRLELPIVADITRT